MNFLPLQVKLMRERKSIKMSPRPKESGNRIRAVPKAGASRDMIIQIVFHPLSSRNFSASFFLRAAGRAKPQRGLFRHPTTSIASDAILPMHIATYRYLAATRNNMKFSNSFPGSKFQAMQIATPSILATMQYQNQSYSVKS
jgi:hypothetical protein